MSRNESARTSASPVKDASVPLNKKIKLSKENDSSMPEVPFGFLACQKYLFSSHRASQTLPDTLIANGPARNDLDKVKNLMENHGFRTSFITSPRSALSIYKDSCDLNLEGLTAQQHEGKTFLLTMLGMHPKQHEIEHWYEVSIKRIYTLFLFGNLVRKMCPRAMKDNNLLKVMETNEQLCQDLAPKSRDDERSVDSYVIDGLMEKVQALSASVSERLAEMTKAIVRADPRLRVEQLEHEYQRLTLWNSTLSNALLQMFLDSHSCCIQNVYFKRSPLPKYERITVYLYDPNVDLVKPPCFTFLPSLRLALDYGPESVTKHMIDTFWESLLRHGYYATKKIKAEFTPSLEKYFLSGIAADPSVPLLLNAHFTPQYPLSFYIHGKAGAGKSSLVRHFSPAINASIEKHVDPELMVRFVKQNLNKPMNVLKLELELRPNNNDLSVMSIIQGRRMTMCQTKPGLVVVDLEEMASNAHDGNPNQLKTSQLISQRFSGRKSDFKEGNASAPRNSTKRGISGDASLIVLFTSNYELEQPCQEALQRLDMFSNLQIVAMTAVDGSDRRDFARSYTKQCIHDRFPEYTAQCEIDLDIPFGSGDTRPLVRHLRMIAFYVCALAADSISAGSSVTAKAVQPQESKLCTVSTPERSMELRVGTLDNVFPVFHQIFDERTKDVMKEIRKISVESADMLDELSQIIDFWFGKTLAPAVVVSNDGDLISNLVQIVGRQGHVHYIEDVEAGSYKMMKSLYDPSDTPNLRDDILQFGNEALVAIELKCSNRDGQLCIREIIEDSPSMTAFSTSKSALYKDGLIFFVHVVGEITPEVKSRASLIL